MLLSDIANLESREHISASKIWNPKIAWNKTSFTIIFPVENAPSRAIDPPLSQRLTKNSPPII
jgi:hypothetical protein